MVNLKQYSLGELEDCLESWREKRYRAKQLFSWIWKKQVDSFARCSDLSKPLREKLARRACLATLTLRDRRVSADGTSKYVFVRQGGGAIEAVLIPSGKRRTACVSSQEGCPLGCRFCATAQGTYRGNLEAWEIADQALQISKIEQVGVTNVVFMGMGEPLLNWSAVEQAIAILNCDHGLDIGARRITVSTAGVVPGIEAMARFPLQVRLAISLNSAIQRKRESLMPIAKQYPLDQLRVCLEHHYRQTHRMSTLEYVLIKGINTSRDDFEHLRGFVHGLKVKLNLIPLNPSKGLAMEMPPQAEIKKFHRWCRGLPCPVSVRRSHGTDIGGACGQLAAHSGANKE